MATKKVKAAAKKVANTNNSNFNKVMTTAKNVNKEIFSTASEVLEDVRNNSAQIRKGATTTFDKVQLKDSFDKIVSTTKKVNAQVLETATEVIEDVVETGKKWGATAYENGKDWGTVTMENVKNRIEDIDVKENMDSVKAVAKKANDFALTTADELVDDALNTGVKWQGVAAKAVKGGLHLAERQQEIVFDTLDTVKDQVIKSASRFKNLLFSKN